MYWTVARSVRAGRPWSRFFAQAGTGRSPSCLRSCYRVPRPAAFVPWVLGLPRIRRASLTRLPSTSRKNKVARSQAVPCHLRFVLLSVGPPQRLRQPQVTKRWAKGQRCMVARGGGDASSPRSSTATTRYGRPNRCRSIVSRRKHSEVPSRAKHLVQRCAGSGRRCRSDFGPTGHFGTPSHAEMRRKVCGRSPPLFLQVHGRLERFDQ